MAWKYLQYDGETGKKRTVSGGSGGASELNDLDDVNVSNPSDGQVLRYDANAGEWVNSNESGGGGNVSDVTVGGVSVVNQQGVAEIPAIPDGLHHYSTTEHVIGTWINNKPLYEKTIDCGYLPNNNVSTIQTGLTNIIAVNAFGFCDNNYQNIFIPNASASGVQWAIGIHLEDSGASLKIRTGADRSGSYAYVTLQYYKTTD